MWSVILSPYRWKSYLQCVMPLHNYFNLISSFLSFVFFHIRFLRFFFLIAENEHFVFNLVGIQCQWNNTFEFDQYTHKRTHSIQTSDTLFWIGLIANRIASLAYWQYAVNVFTNSGLMCVRCACIKYLVYSHGVYL